MDIDLKKIKKLPPDVKKDFMKMYLKLDEKKKILKILRLLKFQAYIQFIEKNTKLI